MIQLKELLLYLDELFNLVKIIDYGPNGLQVEGQQQLTKIATAVSADIETIQKARELNVQALIVHHGVLWTKDPSPITGSKGQKIKLLLDKQISLLAYHLPLDAHPHLGNNWKAALDLGWTRLEPFGVFNGLSIGVRGIFAPLEVEKFQAKLEQYYQHPAVSVCGGKKMVSSAALISGGAWKEMQQAAAVGVDCFISGNFDEPAWSMAKEEKINFFALGHAATEKIGVPALGKHLCEKF